MGIPFYEFSRPDITMTLPDSPGAVMNYTIHAPAIHGSQLALYAVGYRDNLPDGAYPWNAGIYRYASGTLSRVADEQMNVPGSSIPFYEFSRPDIRSGAVIFNGLDYDGLAAGVYTQASPGAPLATIADLSTQVPGRTTNFTGFPYGLDHVALLPDGSALFHAEYQAPPHTASVGKYGIYRTDGPGGPVVAVAEDDVTPIPGSPGSVFTDVYNGTVADADGTIVFSGYGASTRGIFALRNGTLQPIVDTSTLLPDGSKTFGSFGSNSASVNFAYNNGVLLFHGFDYHTPRQSTLHGLYLATLDGEIHKLLSPGQSFDGKTIDYWQLGRDSLDANGIGLSITFTDGTHGIYTTSTAALALPEPASLSLIGGAVALLSRRRTRWTRQPLATSKPIRTGLDLPRS